MEWCRLATSSSEMQRKSNALRGREKDMRCESKWGKAKDMRSEEVLGKAKDMRGEEMQGKAKERQVDIRMGKNICPLEYNEKCKEDFIWDFQAPMKNSGQQ